MSVALKSAGQLSLDVIVDAAVAMIHDDGFDALSMRRLARRCGVAVMTLYGYVRTKEELLTVVADRFLSEIEYPDPQLDWQAQLKEIFRALHRVFMRHPELVDIVGRQYLNSTAAFRGAELTFKAMDRAGLSSQDAVSAFVSLAMFTAGFSQRQAHLDSSPAMQARRMETLRQLPVDEFNRLSQLASVFAAGLDDRHFERGLEFMVQGIAASAHP